MASYIHDLIGTYWSRGATGAPLMVSEVRYAIEGPHMVRLEGHGWYAAGFDDDGRACLKDECWVRRERLPAPTWMDVRDMVHDYLVRLQQLGSQQPYMQRFLTLTTRAFDPEQDRYEMGS
jgi:hypothetical protein